MENQSVTFEELIEYREDPEKKRERRKNILYKIGIALITIVVVALFYLFLYKILFKEENPLVEDKVETLVRELNTTSLSVSAISYLDSLYPDNSTEELQELVAEGDLLLGEVVEMYEGLLLDKTVEFDEVMHVGKDYLQVIKFGEDGESGQSGEGGSEEEVVFEYIEYILSDEYEEYLGKLDAEVLEENIQGLRTINKILSESTSDFFDGTLRKENEKIKSEVYSILAEAESELSGVNDLMTEMTSINDLYITEFGHAILEIDLLEKYESFIANTEVDLEEIRVSLNNENSSLMGLKSESESLLLSVQTVKKEVEALKEELSEEYDEALAEAIAEQEVAERKAREAEEKRQRELNSFLTDEQESELEALENWGQEEEEEEQELTVEDPSE